MIRSVRQYHSVLLDTLVHELNTVRGAPRRARSVDYVDLSEQAVTVAASIRRT